MKYTEADIILQDVDFEPKTEKDESCWLSVYLVSRAYGGPEEGGWWYNEYEFMGGKLYPNWDTAEKALEIAQETAKQMTNEVDRAPYYDVLGDEPNSSYPEGYIPTGWSDGGEYRVIIENTRGENDTTKLARPHYE